MDKKKELQSALKAAQSFLNEKISFEEFLTVYPDDIEDNDINELFDLIEHQPKLGGFLGVSQKTGDLHTHRITETLERLEVRLNSNDSETKPIR